MNRQLLGPLAAAILLAFTGSDATAGLLHQRTLSIDRSVNIFGSTQFDVDLELVAGSPFTSTDRIVLFDSLEVAAGASGDVHRADLSSDPAFAAAATRLSNNLDESILLVLRENASQRTELRGLTESSFFFASTDQPDLFGKRIDAIEISIDRFSLSSTGGGTPPVEFFATISIYGVPEPASTAMLATVGLALCCYRPRRGETESARRRRVALVADH